MPYVSCLGYVYKKGSVASTTIRELRFFLEYTNTHTHDYTKRGCYMMFHSPSYYFVWTMAKLQCFSLDYFPYLFGHLICILCKYTVTCFFIKYVRENDI